MQSSKEQRKKLTERTLKGNFGLVREDCQQAVTDEFLCIVADCLLETNVLDVETKSTWCKVRKIPF